MLIYFWHNYRWHNCCNNKKANTRNRCKWKETARPQGVARCVWFKLVLMHNAFWRTVEKYLMSLLNGRKYFPQLIFGFLLTWLQITDKTVAINYLQKCSCINQIYQSVPVYGWTLSIFASYFIKPGFWQKLHTSISSA